MGKQDKSKKIGQKSDKMNSMDQGLNVIVQAVNQVTGLDKGNDGEKKKN